MKQNDAHVYDQRYTSSLLGANMRRMNKLAFNEWFHQRDKAQYPQGDIVEDSCREIRGHYDQGMNGVSCVGVQDANSDLEAIVARLKKEGVWNAPVVRRKLDDPVHVRLSTLLDLNGWQIKERCFDPAFRTGRQQVNVLIELDLKNTLLPLIPPRTDVGAP